MARMREGDTVKVIAGNYKGRSGKIISFKDKNHVVVEGINVRKKAVKKQGPEDTGFIEIFAPINISNIALMITKEDKDLVVKLKSRINSDGNKELHYKVEGNSFVHRVISSSKVKQ